MRGNILSFSWHNGVRLHKAVADTWRADITYRSANDGFSCRHYADNTSFTGDLFEYRIFLDDQVDMVGGNLRLKLPISQASSYLSRDMTRPTK